MRTSKRGFYVQLAENIELGNPAAKTAIFGASAELKSATETTSQQRPQPIQNIQLGNPAKVLNGLPNWPEPANLSTLPHLRVEV